MSSMGFTELVVISGLEARPGLNQSVVELFKCNLYYEGDSSESQQNNQLLSLSL